MIFEYVTVLQVYGIQILIAGIGCLCSAVKFFSIDEATSVLRIIRMMSWPAMAFREIAKSDLTWNTYKPLLHSFLTQLTIHAVAFAICFLFSPGNKMARFLRIICGFSYNSFMYYGYPLIRVLFGEEYLYIPVVMNVVQTMLMRPLHLLGLLLLPAEQLANNDAGDDKQLEDLEKPLNEEQENIDVESDQPRNVKRNVLSVTFSTVNVCALFGVLWSVTKWKFPIILEIIVKNFEMSVIGTSLFCIGVMLWAHPFKGCDYKEVIMMLIAHHFVNPLIAFAWTWILRFDSLNQQACTLLFAMPIDWSGADLYSKIDKNPNSVTYCMFWSHAISLLCVLLWIVVFNHTGIFSL